MDGGGYGSSRTDDDTGPDPAIVLDACTPVDECEFIDADIWQLWKGGMTTALSKPAFKQGWEIICKDTKYGRTFETFVERLIDYEEAH